MATPEETLLSKGYRTWLLGVLLTISTFSFIDRVIFSTLSQSIKQDLGMTDLQLGWLQGLGFAIPFMVLALPIGWLAERVSRVGIIAVAITVWSVATAFCGATTNFVQLLFARIGLGAGEAGFNPSSFSLVSDHYTSERRTSALAIIGLGSPIGALVGGVLAGYAAQHLGWRTAFVVIGLPGIIAGLVAFFTLKEPPRGLAEGYKKTKEPAPSLLAVAKVLFTKPTFINVLIGGSLAGAGMSAVGQFSAPYYIRVFHLSVQDTGTLHGLISFVSLGAGMLFGAKIAERAARKNKKWYALSPAIGVLVAAPLYAIGFQAPSIWVAAPCILFGGLALFFYYAPALATVQNLVGPRMRASAAGFYALVFGLVGTGLGPTLLGTLSDMFAVKAFTAGDLHVMCKGGRAVAGSTQAVADACAGASAEGIRTALTVITLLFVWSSIHFLLASRTLAKDFYTPPAQA